MDVNFIFYVIILVIILVGLVGNIVTFIVFSRPTFEKNSISIYCRALAIFDSYILYQVIVLFYLIIYNYYIVVYSDALCKLIFYIFYAFGSIPGWILIAFSLDKVLHLKKVINGMKRPIVHYMIILGIVLFNLILYIEVPIYMRIVSVDYNGVNLAICEPSTLYFANFLGITYIIEGSILPFVILFVSSIYTIKLLRDSRRQVSMTGQVAETRKNREYKFAITSISFSFTFIVLKIPFVICVSVGFAFIDAVLIQIASLLFFLNFSIGFFVHLASNSLFRRELLVLFRIRKPINDSTTTFLANQATNRLSNTMNQTNIY